MPVLGKLEGLGRGLRAWTKHHVSDCLEYSPYQDANKLCAFWPTAVEGVAAGVENGDCEQAEGKSRCPAARVLSLHEENKEGMDFVPPVEWLALWFFYVALARVASGTSIQLS